MLGSIVTLLREGKGRKAGWFANKSNLMELSRGFGKTTYEQMCELTTP